MYNTRLIYAASSHHYVRLAILFILQYMAKEISNVKQQDKRIKLRVHTQIEWNEEKKTWRKEEFIDRQNSEPSIALNVWMQQAE